MRKNQLRPRNYQPTYKEILDAYSRDFYKESKVDNPDPSSGFHPNNAISNSSEAFQASTSPETQKIKKKIYVSGHNVLLYSSTKYDPNSTFKNFINSGFEVFFVFDDEILKLESIEDDKFKFSNNNIGKIKDNSIEFIYYYGNERRKLSQKPDQEILNEHHLVADDSYFLTQKEFIKPDYFAKHLRARLVIPSDYALDDGSYRCLSNFFDDLDYFCEKNPEKKSTIKRAVEDYYVEIGKPLKMADWYKQEYEPAMISFLNKILEIVEIAEIRKILDNSGEEKNFIHTDIMYSEIIHSYRINHNLTAPPEELSSNNNTNPKSLYLGNASINGDITRNNDSKFELKEVGKVIKGDEVMGTRIAPHKLNIKTNKTGISNTSSLTDDDQIRAGCCSSLKLSFFKMMKSIKSLLNPNPQFFEEVTTTQFTDLEKQPTQLDGLIEDTSLKKNIFQFDNFKLKKGVKTRLYSVNSEEELLNYKTNSKSSTSPKIKFFKGDDGFYYAQSNQDCSITYQVGFDQSRYLKLAKGKTFTEKNFGAKAGDDLSANSKISSAIDILNEYQGQDHFTTSVKSEEYSLPEFKDKNKFAEDLYTLPKQGSCSHRTIAIAYQFEKKGLKLGEDYRIIDIEKTHFLIELKGYDGKFYQVDLGGAQANITIKENTQKASTLESLPSPTPTPVSLEKASLIKAVDKQTKLEKIDELDAFKDKIHEKKSKNILIQTRDIENCTNFLIKQSKETESKRANIFQVKSPQDLKIDAQTLQISSATDSNAVNITNETPFSKFLAQARSNPSENFQLVINWQNFSANEKVAFNSLFDQARSIHQQSIPDNIQIIAIEKPKEIPDSSILSRFDDKFLLSPNLQKKIGEELVAKSSEESIETKHIIDFEGNPDWLGMLFGKIKLDFDQLTYKKSEFVELLEKAQLDQNLNIEFRNISPQNAQELSNMLESSKAYGYYDYHGKRILFPSNLKFSFSEEQFDFKSLSTSQISCTTDYVASSPSEIENLKIVNQSDFEKLLVKPQIPSQSSGTSYRELPGLIEESKDNKLSLLITSDLTINQWYLLLKRSSEQNVELDLKIAKGVNLPDNDNLKELLGLENKKAMPLEEELTMGYPTSDATTDSSQKRIFIVDDSTKFIESNSRGFSFADSIIIDIEEQGFDALFGKKNFKINVNDGGEQSFEVFKESNGLDDILENNPDKKIILRGEFSDKTMQILMQKMLSADPKYQNLYFVFEDTNLAVLSPEAKSKKLSETSLAFLGADFYEEKTLKPRVEEWAGIRDGAGVEEKVKKPIIREAIPSITTFYTKTDEQITETSETFKTKRKALIEQQLQDNKMLLISGSAGVGKSYFMKALSKEKNHQLFFGKEAIKDWAKSRIDETETSSIASDSDSKKLSILVIDEYNVDGSTNYLMFRDLDKKKFLFHQGEIIELQDNHRVVFMGNSLEYGNRFQQKLFDKESIQEIEFKDFPAEYIYEELIKKPIFGETSPTESAEISGSFKIFCQEAITEYKSSNQGGIASRNLKQKPQTVRELQEKILDFLSREEVKDEFKLFTPIKISSDNFIETSATQELCQKLSNAIQIRKHQFNGKISSSCVGTPGFIVEGDAGVGKSVMIEAVLNHQNISEVKSLDNLTLDDKQQHFYKINASSDIEKIKKDLIKAYELGVIVVFDEINTKTQEGGLEQIINDLLTNQHPNQKGGNPLSSVVKPGFMLIGSINSASSAGRVRLSPAIQSRCHYQKAKKLTDYTENDLTEIIEHWRKTSKQSPEITDSTENLVKFFKETIQKKPELSLRDMQKIILRSSAQNNEILQ